jgi:predicted transcriptional regulator
MHEGDLKEFEKDGEIEKRRPRGKRGRVSLDQQLKELLKSFLAVLDILPGDHSRE